MRLIFVRHGEPDYQNDCLTENGRIQAHHTAERLKNENITAVYSSPMGRAVETAAYTAKMHGLNVNVLDFMHEIDWGDVNKNALENKLEYDGHPWMLGFKLLAEFPRFVGSADWSRHHFFKDNICLEYYKKISQSFDEFLASFGLIRKDGLYYYQIPCNDTVALFAHGGSGAVMFSHVLNLPFPFVLTTMPYGVCSVSVVDFTPQLEKIVVPRLELFNDMTHLKNVKLEKLHFEK